LRFAVRRPGIPEASPRSNGVPRRDVPGRVHISVAGKTAGRAHEARLTLARLRVYVPARRGDGHAAVNSYDLPAAWCRDRIRDSREGDMPAPGPIHRHSVGLHVWWHRSGPAEPYPPDLRNPDLADMARQAVYIPLRPASAHDAESLVLASLAPRRPPCRVLRVEERGHRLGEVPQCLLLHHLGASGQPRVFCPRLGELTALFQVSRCAFSAWPPVRVLLDGEIPYVPGVGAVIPQHRPLSGRRIQPVPRHANRIANTSDISWEVKRRCLLGPRLEY
jgi:hypothetical protein